MLELSRCQAVFEACSHVRLICSIEAQVSVCQGRAERLLLCVERMPKTCL